MLAEWDARAGSGSFTVTTKRVIEGPGYPKRTIEERWQCTFDEESGSISTISGTTDGVLRPVESVHSRNGVDVAIDSEKKTVHVRPSPNSKADRANYALGLSPGPSIGMGRGLSKLSEVELSGTEDGPVLSGKFPDNSLIRAELAPECDWLPRRIERSFPDGPAQVVWTYDLARSEDGRWFPRLVTSKTRNTQTSFQASYRFESLHLGRSTGSKTLDWCRPGYEIFDDRVTPRVRFTSEELIKLAGKRDPSIQDLLVQSKLRSAQLGKLQEQSSRMDNRSKPREFQIPAWLVLASVLLAIGTLGVIWRRLAA